MFLRLGVNSHITHEALLSPKSEPIYLLGQVEYIANLAPVGRQQDPSQLTKLLAQCVTYYLPVVNQQV
ncbi:unannotated protein [freshwater metagenome]|uniref:Unannotated protein n=1 Tax=freshwater metagenome TaxID=449393 RepID=A0A6J6XD03_9ZZZZ